MQQKEVQLVQRATDGDREAFGLLYDRYAAVVRAVCFDVTQNLEQAQDLAQEVFVRAYRRLDTLREPDRFASWLLGIARHVNQEWIKKRIRDRKVQVGIPSDSLAVDANDQAASERRIGLALSQLPEKQRLALHLFHLQGKSADEARHILGMSSSGYYKLLRAARRRLTLIIAKGE